MNETEKSFKRLMTKIGTAMLIFFVAFTVSGEIIVLLDSLLYYIFDYRTATVVYNLAYAVLYALPFVGASVFLFFTTQSDTVSIAKKVSLSPELPFYIVVAIAATAAFSYANQYFVEFFNYSEFMADSFGIPYSAENYEIALMLLTSAVIPGIFEELLFRGAILTRLRPYGKSASIIISAVLFGLMHQNAGQFLYATAAGLILGWVTVNTGSLICSMLCHFINNAWAVIQQVLFVRLPENEAVTAFAAVGVIIFVLGIAGALVLTVAYYRKKRVNDFSSGMFGRDLELKYEMDTVLPPMQALKLFWRPTVIVFTCVSAATAMLYLILSVLNSGVGL